MIFWLPDFGIYFHFSTSLKLTFNSSILIKVSNWDLKRALDRLQQQKVNFNSSPSDVQLALEALYLHGKNLCKLRLLTHVGFFRQNGLILSEVFCIWKGTRILKKNLS